MKWIDLCEIVIVLVDKYFDIDLQWINFVDLCQWVFEFDGFDDDLMYLGEKIFEVIQVYWIDELDFDDED